MKQYLLKLEPHLFDEIKLSADEVDSTMAAYIRRAVKAHILLQKNHLKTEIENVRTAKRIVEQQFWLHAEAEAEEDFYLS